MSSKSFIVTETNISSVPHDWLFARYQRIERMLVHSDNPKLQKELELIRNHLQDDESTETVEQLELDIPLAVREQYAPIVEYRLREYYELMQQKKSLEFLIQTIRPSEPKVTASYDSVGGSGSGGLTQSSTERAVMAMFHKIDRYQAEIKEVEEKMYPMQRAIRSLRNEQRMLIERKYLLREEPLDEQLMMELRWYRKKFYHVKKVALISLAQSLRIV
ncbi:hypothetical protein [Paenibacillus graminis]|uniref:hypothetical protein n=1 Tax=Paenibacillus graminis TaxID=189425 RepID=UPI002DB8C414|nr:hypothetical protein [Paenibacillus graminis]MEC0167398.1 hypothetical protein [Paenibacillus graminis]